MKQLNRRKFLLFVSSSSLLYLTGCNPPIKNEKLESTERKIKEILTSGRKLTLKWECGGDEALVYPFVDGKEMNFESDLYSEIDMLILNLLELPSAGEFSMDGTGEVILENNKIYLVCESIMHGYEDYSMEGESLGWKDVNEVDSMYSGKHPLFE